jgi:hypothetical protein
MDKVLFESLMLGPIIPIQDHPILTAVPSLVVVQPFLSTVWPWQELVMPSVVAMQSPAAVLM